MSEVLVGLGFENPLDVSTVRGSNRLLTRAIASWAYHATDESDEAKYSGIKYVSRLGHHECWAVFDGTPIQMLGTAVIRRMTRTSSASPTTGTSRSSSRRSPRPARGVESGFCRFAPAGA
jgi:hypothetical protein